MTTIVVVSTAYRAEQYAARCVESVMGQTLQVPHVFMADDAPTLFVAEQALKRQLHRSVLTVLRHGYGSQLESVYRVMESLPPETVVCWLDGDDWLARPDAIEIVRSVYDSGDVWLTFGSFECWPHDPERRGCAPYAPDVVADGSYRKAPWLASHLKTFRAGLFLAIRERDLKQPDGSWMTEVTDRATMWPMLEMAGERHRFIPEVLVTYNGSNPRSIPNAGGERLSKEAFETERMIRMPRYPRLPWPPWELPAAPWTGTQ